MRLLLEKRVVQNISPMRNQGSCFICEVSMTPDIMNISEAEVSDRRGVGDFRYVKDTIIVDDREYFDTKLFKIRMGR